MSCSQVHSLTLLYCCKVSRKTLFNEHQTLWGFSRAPNRYYTADMALHILGKNLKRIIGCLDGRALLFFQTFPSFFFSSFDSGDLVEGRFFSKTQCLCLSCITCMAHSTECGCLVSVLHFLCIPNSSAVKIM